MAASEMKFAFDATVDEAARRAVVWSSDHRTATGDERGIRRRAARIAAAKWDGRTFAAAATFADRAESMARLQKSLAAAGYAVRVERFSSRRDPRLANFEAAWARAQANAA